MTKVESTTAERKEFIFQLLKHDKIASVSYSFSGSGDSGEFTDTEVTMEEGVEDTINYCLRWWLLSWAK